MTHYHIHVWIGSNLRVGALCTTWSAAEQEANVEREGDKHRRVEIVKCDKGCFRPMVEA